MGSWWVTIQRRTPANFMSSVALETELWPQPNAGTFLILVNKLQFGHGIVFEAPASGNSVAGTEAAPK
jgi:hypothetical protein